MPRILYFLFKSKKNIQSMYELNEKAPVIMISLTFHHRSKIISVTWRKIARSPQVLRKHITWRNFLKESLARNKVFKMFMNKLNEKAHLILISLFFHQNFEWENVAHNCCLIFRSSFCYTGFTEWYVSLSVGDGERVSWRIEF